MRKRISILAAAAAVALALFLCGCDGGILPNHNTVNTFGNTTNGIFLYPDLSLEDVVYYPDFGEPYDAAEFKELLLENVEVYNNTRYYQKPADLKDVDGNTVYKSVIKAPVEVIQCEAKGSVLVIRLRYATVEDYLSYKAFFDPFYERPTLKTGYLSEVDPEILTATYTDADGESVDIEALCMSVRKAPVYRYVLADFDCVLYGEGYMVGYSYGGTYNSTANCVTVTKGNPVVVIYATPD
ncbi:MAG: hypothetical protein J6Z23_05375 [Lachnospiraceae bacterium]|nr:hypothetical protein [Lachnospiraceae bacterium]MBP5254796.1 hypothetical protein [Lachnospiraceae bacterium]